MHITSCKLEAFFRSFSKNNAKPQKIIIFSHLRSPKNAHCHYLGRQCPWQSRGREYVFSLSSFIVKLLPSKDLAQAASVMQLVFSQECVLRCDPVLFPGCRGFRCQCKTSESSCTDGEGLQCVLQLIYTSALSQCGATTLLDTIRETISSSV